MSDEATPKKTKKQLTLEDRARITAIKELAAEIRVIPDGLYAFAVVKGKSLEEATAIFNQYQATGHYSEGGSSFGEPPKAKE